MAAIMRGGNGNTVSSVLDDVSRWPSFGAVDVPRNAPTMHGMGVAFGHGIHRMERGGR